MRFLIVALIFVGIVEPSFATVDPDPDQIGIYFDTNADVTCIDVPPLVSFWAYVIVTNPSSEVLGIEFSLCVECIGGYETSLLLLNDEWWFGPRITPVELEWCPGGVIMGWGTPLIPQDANAVVVGLQYMLSSDMGLQFYLGPASPQYIEDGLPAYLGTGNVALPLGVSSGDPGLPVASVNGCNAVTVEGTTFGTMKCLFR